MRSLILLLFISTFSFAQSPKVKDILGKCSVGDLGKEPHAAWYSKNYADYNANGDVLKKFKKTDLAKYKIKIIFGSWCGDSKREVPRMTKLLDQLSFDQKNLELIAVDDSTQVYKQSPGHEERGLEIYRVPTFIVYDKDKEIGRIVEYPVESLERDLFNIVTNNYYTPNYFSYPYVQKWLNNGVLADKNVSPRGLAGNLLSKVQYESELNSCGYVLMARGQLDEAIAVFRINTSLFPKSPNCLDSLGEAYAKAGLKDRAIQSYEAVLKLEPENERAKGELKKLRGE